MQSGSTEGTLYLVDLAGDETRDEAGTSERVQESKVSLWHAAGCMLCVAGAVEECDATLSLL